MKGWRCCGFRIRCTSTKIRFDTNLLFTSWSKKRMVAKNWPILFIRFARLWCGSMSRSDARLSNVAKQLSRYL